jgi:hypothetical protein
MAVLTIGVIAIAASVHGDHVSLQRCCCVFCLCDAAAAVCEYVH